MIPKNILAQLNAVLGENYSPRQVTMYKESFDPVNYKNDHFVFVGTQENMEETIDFLKRFYEVKDIESFNPSLLGDITCRTE